MEEAEYHHIMLTFRKHMLEVLPGKMNIFEEGMKVLSKLQRGGFINRGLITFILTRFVPYLAALIKAAI